MDNLRKLEELTQHLTEVENQFKNLFMFTNDLMCVASSDFRLVEVNPAWTRILGFPREYFINKNYLDMLHPDDVEPTRKVAAGLVDVSVKGFRNRYLHKDGHYVTVEWSACPYTVDGKTYGVARVVEDAPE